MTSGVFFTIVILLGVTVFIAMLRSGHFVRAIALTVLQGVAALFAVNLAGMITGTTLAVNWYTIGVSCIGGTAGVIMMLVAKTMMM